MRDFAFWSFCLGASAGAGSGEFDIYRGCRRRQMIREAYLNRQAKEVNIHRYSWIVLCLCMFSKKPMRNGKRKLKVLEKDSQRKQKRNDRNGK